MSATRQLRHGVSLLPALLTTGNLLAGFFCIIEASRSHFGHAAILIVLAGILDGFDGRIARMTGTTSEFGLQYDSLADIVSFGLAPALLAYFWALIPLRRVGWLVAFLFVVAAATRLARFNIQGSTIQKRYFVGLPSPAAAGTVASVVFAFRSPPDRPWQSVLVAVVVGATALLMVTRLRFRSFKDLDLRNRRSSIWVLIIAAALVMILSEPRYTLITLATVYALSGPFAHLYGLFRRRRPSADEPAQVADDPAVR